MKTRKRRWIAGFLASVMLCSSLLQTIPVIGWAAGSYQPGDSLLIGTEKLPAYCIDSFELLGEAGGIMGGVNEEYTYVLPSSRLSDEECAVLFWAVLSMLADRSEGVVCRDIIEKINAQASAKNLPQIGKHVTEHDLKLLLHLKSVKNQYPWLASVTANAQSYMEMAGLSGKSGGTSVGGKEIPSVLSGHTTAASALAVDKNTLTIPFDASGADRDFIRKVPMQFSATGGEPWTEALSGGWSCQKTDTSIVFSNTASAPPPLFVRFNPSGTEYQRGSGYESPQELYNRALQLWVCTKCSNLHVYHSHREMPLEAHQRLVNLQLEAPTEQYYAVLGDAGVTVGAGAGSLAFLVYRHAEDMKSTYNLQFYKYDHETGKPLERAAFKLYERFDDAAEIDRSRDGAVHIYEGGEPYQSYHKDSPVVWDDFKFVSGMATDEDGYAAKTVNHAYHYDKTFCDGHPAPQFVSVPEEEEDEETGEIVNEAEIEAAQAENQRLAREWLDCSASCEAHADGEFSGVHFHWLMPEVDRGEIEQTESSGGSPGETPDAGKTVSASAEESYRESGCQADCEETYEKFIGLRYSYALVESSARPGYILHDIHRDDLPIEVITTDASEHGANAEFAGEYGKEIRINHEVSARAAEEILAERERIAAVRFKDMVSEREPEEGEEVRSLKKVALPYQQQALRFLTPVEQTETEDGNDMEDGTDMEEQEDWEAEDVELIDDVSGEDAAWNSKPVEPATPGNARKPENQAGHSTRLATPSNLPFSTPSNVSYLMQVHFTHSGEGNTDAAEKETAYYDASVMESALFSGAYDRALNGSSFCEAVEAGPDYQNSHCNDADGEGNAWRIYDHRTEGEIHINKRDMELQTGESQQYDSYGDTQGDGTLEGAVYGLFAATDIIHPDGKTGVVYRANNLVAVAATDKNGDASFPANTEAPGHCYDYKKGEITKTPDNWADSAPANLYVRAAVYDDYTEDGRYVRSYPDYTAANGNCWIGRPLLMGNYYVKELSRSEGYELSIGNRDNAQTNYGQDYELALPEGKGYANIAKRLYAEGQIAPNPTGAYGDPDINELFFQAESRGTGQNGFDIVLHHVPAGAKVYRLDTGMVQKELEVGTGFMKRYL